MSRRFQNTKLSSQVGPKGQGALLEHQVSYDDSLLPDAVELEKLIAIDPEIMSWIKERTSKEQDARIEFNQRKMALLEYNAKTHHKESNLTVTFAFLIIVLGMLFSFALIYFKLTVVGTIFAGGTIIFAANAFIRYRKNTPPAQNK